MDLKGELHQAIIMGQISETPGMTDSVLGSGVEPMVLMNEVLIPAMQVVGEKFEKQEYFVPEVLVAARAMQGSLAILRPLLAASGASSAGHVTMGTVKGDIHEIGKNIVCMVLEGAGFEVNDLGVDVAVGDFVRAAEDGTDIIGMSSLLTTSRNFMRDTIEALQEAGLRERVKVIVGGAAVTPEFANAIGADAFARDANEAVRTIADIRKGAQIEPL